MHLVALEERYAHMINPTEPLPPEYERLMMEVDGIAKFMQAVPMQQLASWFAASPPMRNCYERQRTDRGTKGFDLLFNMDICDARWRMHELFSLLTNYDRWSRGHVLVPIVEEIQRTIDHGGAERDLISGLVGDQFSDLALLVEIERQFDLYKPWVCIWRVLKNGAEIGRLWDSISRPITEMDTALENLDLGEEADLTTGRRFYYAAGKRRTKQTTEEMYAAEKNLDAFWMKIDTHHQKHTGQTIHEKLKRYFTEPGRCLHRTKPWVEPIPIEKGKLSSLAVASHSTMHHSLQELNLNTLDPPLTNQANSRPHRRPSPRSRLVRPRCR
ncbi:hypothetical protein M8818_007273 [Zalaria obscura]|uniref:Uncharacterized protein n=1 Tax=Zalaria obscura TaxID=2024903 RepID=A0ACC3S5J2_9PEZI